MHRTIGLVASVIVITVGSVFGQSAFYPAPLVQRIRAATTRDSWGAELGKQAIEAAEPWKRMSDDQLWELVFGATLPRSWHVWSAGYCPACKKPVLMYDWKIDAMKTPWKVQCPHCQALFPTNDFHAFYKSGLDEHGVFDAKKADRSLLYNADHPDAKDPLHTFGVDDGQGYVDEAGHRWRFIPTYLIFGQWKQRILSGIRDMAVAYLFTGDKEYAHKTAVLLDRVADVYPTFDFWTQGILYESDHGHGYVSVWHDATIETREMALAYDAIKDGIVGDESLATFVVGKSREFHTPRSKSSVADVKQNIEERILRDALNSPDKIYSNYPQRELTQAVINTVLGWPANREQVLAMLDPVLEKTTAVDGVTGEKGLANYSAYAVQRLAEFLGYYSRMDDQFLPEMIRRHPRLPQAYRFFIDTWCLEKYYPLSGDTGWFAGPQPIYAGVTFSKQHGLGSSGHSTGVLAPSMYGFLYQLYQATHDAAFAQVIYKSNDSKIDGLPYDLCAGDPKGVRDEIQRVIDKDGSEIRLGSINKQQWHLAILRSGEGKNARALWLDYDSGGGHGHQDGMNLGLFAKGLDLMPDFGYPLVEFGGWYSQRGVWYKTTAAHNTVLVNNSDQPTADGHTTLWADGKGFAAIGADAPGMIPATDRKKYERTVALIDLSKEESYCLDIFRVVGGSEQDKFFMCPFGTITTLGVRFEPTTDYSQPQMRDFQVARKPNSGWSVDWKVDDFYKTLPPGSGDVQLRYTDFTNDADAYICQVWVVAGNWNSSNEKWMPRLMIRRKSTATNSATAPAGTVASTFVSLMEPYDSSRPMIAKAERLVLTRADGGGPCGDANVALLVGRQDGTRDVVVSMDEGEGVVARDDLRVRTDAKLAFVHLGANGRPTRVALCQGSHVAVGGFRVKMNQRTEFVEFDLDGDANSYRRVAGSGEAGEMVLDGRDLVSR